MGQYKRIAGIYLITTCSNKKVYVGHSKNIKKRWANHRNRLRTNTHVNKHLQNAWSLYGGETFSFSILETLSFNLTKEEYEKIETKWVFYYQSHLSQYGYNSVLPGNFPLRKEEENITAEKRKLTDYVCINISTREVVEVVGYNEVEKITTIKKNKVNEFAIYWENKGIKKSSHGWLVVRKKQYIPTFDYIGYKKIRKDYSQPNKIRKPKKVYLKKSPENIIPHSERNLKRTPIVAINISTGEEIIYPMLKSCSKDFLIAKVQMCLKSEFGKHQHRYHYFKRI